MSYTITYTCEWCGKEHNDASREIRGHVGSKDDFKIDDLCPGCYKKIRRSLKSHSDIHTGNAITFNRWLISVSVAAGLGAFIWGVILTC